MPIVNDPEAGGKKPAVPVKRTVTPAKPAPITPPRLGPSDPANQPGNYYGQHGEVDNGDYIGSSTMPGYLLHQATASGDAYSPDEYREWLFRYGADPTFAKMRAHYGDAYVAYEWFAYRTNQNNAEYMNEIRRRFPGYQTVVGDDDDSHGNSGGGGGGGGMSKEQQYAAAEAAIRNQSDSYGQQMDDSSIKAIAKVVVDDNWSGDQLTDYLLQDPAAITREGSFSATVEQIKSMAANQLVVISDDTAKGWAKRMLSGEMGQDTVSQILMQQATSEFGWAADALKTGASMRDVLSPARDTIARELEMNPADINLMDERWRKMVQVAGDDGTPRGATMTEAIAAARKDGAYASTNGAARLGAQTATILRNVFEG